MYNINFNFIYFYVSTQAIIKSLFLLSFNKFKQFKNKKKIVVNIKKGNNS